MLCCYFLRCTRADDKSASSFTHPISIADTKVTTATVEPITVGVSEIKTVGNTYEYSIKEQYASSKPCQFPADYR